MARPGKRVGNQYFARVLRGIGAPVTPNNLRFLRAMQRGEGTNATWNPLATTRSAGGSTSFNSVGVQNFNNRRSGIEATIQTFKNGHYPGILADLKANVPAATIASRRLAELKTWGTGSHVAALLPTTSAGRVPTGSRTQTPHQVTRGPSTMASDPVADTRQKILILLALRSMRESGGSIAGAMPLLVELKRMRESTPTPEAPRTPNRTPSAAGAPRQMYSGRGLQLPRPGSFSITHQTSGLNGYPAHDFMMAAGSPVYAPFTGTISRTSGHAGGTAGGAAGFSIYLRGAGGTAFLTHFDWDKQIVKKGMKVKKGQLIGYVMAYPGGANHIHYGFNSG